MKIFFLDDNADRHRLFFRNRIGEDITPAWNYDEAAEILSKTAFEVVHLDHDLSELAQTGEQPADEKTGTDVAKFIATLPKEMHPHLAVIHSFNPVGARRMASILMDAGITCMISPFRG